MGFTFELDRGAAARSPGTSDDTPRHRATVIAADRIAPERDRIVHVRAATAAVVAPALERPAD